MAIRRVSRADDRL